MVSASLLVGRDRAPEMAAPPVESVRRAIRILNCFRFDRTELTISDIARELELHKSTVHRLLHTLELEGFITPIDGNRFVLGWRLLELGEVVRAGEPLSNVVIDYLRGLVVATGETAHLAIFDRGDVLYVEKVEASRSLRMPSSVGKRVPAHCTALGKVFLAALSDEELRAYLVSHPLTAFTPNTITEARRLETELERVRVDGYAIDAEEIEEGLMCLAAPIADDQGQICAAISIAGPVSRITPRRSAQLDQIKETCRLVTLRLGPRARELKDRG